MGGAMHRFRIWALESDYDAEAIQLLANKIKEYLSLENANIEVVGKKALNAFSKQGKNENGLIKAVRNYLKEDDTLIFVIDSDGPMASFARQHEPHSLGNQINNVLSDPELRSKVFRADAVCELEAWLLIDCIGIMCYYLRKQSKNDTREYISRHKKLLAITKNYQRGKTNLITEAVMGGRGVKEYLKDYSRAILQAIRPNMPDKNMEQEQYSEASAPKIASYILVNSQTLAKNDSFNRFSEILKRRSS